MSTFFTFHEFVSDICLGKHDLSQDTIKVALSNVLSSIQNGSILANITQIAATGGYVNGGYVLAGRVFAEKTPNSGVFNFKGNDILITANGGTIGPFRYAVLYNDTRPNKPLIGMIDFGASILLADGNAYRAVIPPLTGLFDIGAGTIAP